jgi:putative membrane protein
VHIGFGAGPLLVEIFVVALGVAFWGGLIVLIFLGIRWLLRQDRRGSQGSGGSAGGPPAEDPYEILRRRYAAGEIDDEEYARRRKTLAGK